MKIVCELTIGTCKLNRHPPSVRSWFRRYYYILVRLYKKQITLHDIPGANWAPVKAQITNSLKVLGWFAIKTITLICMYQMDACVLIV